MLSQGGHQRTKCDGVQIKSAAAAAGLSDGKAAIGSQDNGDQHQRAGLIFPIFVISAIINRILYRIQLVPMKDYTYFISQFSCW